MAEAPAERPVAGAAQLPACTIIGTAASETLVGTAGDDVICALGGDDVVRGRGGDDTLFGSFGDDRLEGGPGDDLLKGHWGTDRLKGGRGDDVLHGGGNADVLAGGAGRDLADYGTRFRPVRVSIGRGADDGVTGEDDRVRGNVEDVRGGSADDTFIGDGGPNRLYGRRGDDMLKGGRGNDRSWGGAGVDRLKGRDGARFADALDCGPGRPDAAIADAGDRVASDCERVRQPEQPPGERNRAPTDVTLSSASVAENRPAGTVVGTLGAVDADAGDVHRFALVAGSGGGDNAAFAIEGDQLRTAAVFDYEAEAGYSIRVRVTDGRRGAFERTFAVSVTDVVEIVNHAPSNILLSAAAVAENEPAGTTVGTLSAVDTDAGQAHGFALVAGAGDADNGSFEIVGASLRTAAVFDFEAKASYSIRVRATDNGTPALSAERVFTVTVADDAAEPPTAGPTPPATTAEDTPVTITLSASDPEGDDPLTFATGAPTNGSLGAIGPVTCSHATPNVCTADVLFTPAADYNGPAGFAYTANDGSEDSLPATVPITVDPVNDAPVAQPGARSTNEDTPVALNLAALVSDVETADANLTYEIVTPPAHGTATATTYTPAGDFNGSDSLTYRVSDRGDPDDCSAAPCDAPETSTTETVSITVSPVNDTPTATAASVGVAEDGALPIDLAALAADVETADANLTYTIVTPPAHGAFAGGTYTPAGDFNGTDSFSYQVTDRGDPDNCGAPGPACDAPETSSTQTVSITVTAVNDAPVNTLPAGPLTAVQDTDTPLTGISIADVDAGADNMLLALSVDHGTLTVNTTVLGGVGVSQVAANGSADVTITASLTQINATLANATGLVYHGDAPYTGPDTLTVTTSDLGHNGAGGPLTDTDTLAITVTPPNAAPVAAAQSVSTNEDTPLAITLSASDADGDALTLTTATGPANGSLGPLDAVNCTGATPNVCTADITYTPAADSFGPDSFTFTASDGIATSAAATISITVNAVNDAPTLASTEGGALAYTENDPATPVTATTTVADVDSANFDTGTLTVDHQAGGTADDRLEIANQGTGPGQIGVSGASVSYEGTQIGTFTGGTGTTPLVVTLGADATAAAAQALVRAVTFRNVSDAPTAARTVRFVLTDGDGGTSTPATRAIAVTAVNDPPVVDLDAPAGLTYTEQAGFVNLFGPAATVTDVDSPTLDSLTVAITAGFDAAFDTLDVNTAGFTADFAGGVLTITRAGGTPAEFTTALRNVRFRNTDDDPDDRDDGTANPSAADRTVSVVADDGPATSTPGTRNITITPVNDAPGAPTPAPTADSVRNTTLVSGANSVTGPKVTRTVDLEANATDPDGPESAITVVPAAAAATAQGGRITLSAAGDLVYEAPASVTLASDTYGYQLTDGTTASAAITFTVNLSGEVWYVADSAPLPRDGTAARPFDTLAGALAVATTNDAIHVRRAPGDGTLTAGVTLLAGQKLLGEGVALTGTDVGASGSPGTLFAVGTKPVLTAAGADVVTLANTTEIAGLSINPDGAGGGLAGTDPTAVTVRGADITDTGTQASQPGIELTTGGGLTFSGTVTLAMPAARALALTGTALSGTLAGTSAGGTTGGVSLTNTTGNLTFQTLNLTTTGGTGFLLANAANIDVDGAGFATTVSSTGGPAIDATGLAGGSDLVFDTITASGGAKGVNLDGTGNWTFNAGAGSAISGATTAAFDVNGGSGAVTYAGSIANGTGEAADITARSGNTTISGNITGAGGTGVNVANNTAGTTTVSGATKTLNTGTNQAVTLTSNTGHTINFTAGGLDIDTTSGTGFGATGGGTITVQGAANTLTSGTGTALSVANTTIGASDLTFQAISAIGGANGIVLTNSGASGNLVVTGDGDGNPDGGGGTISNSTNHAINVNNTLSPSLTDMTVTNAGDADNEYGLHLVNVSGTVALDDMTFNNAADNLVYLNSTSSSTINVTGSVFSYPGVISATANSALLLEPSGAADLTASITGSTFTDIRSAATQIGANTAGASGILSLTFSNNTINSAPGRAGGVVVSGQELTTTSLTITNNAFTGAGGNGVISIDTNDTSTVTGTISDNVISNPPGIGIFSAVDEAATSTLTFNGNTVTNAGGDGIQLVNFGGAGSSTMNATVTANAVNGHSLNTAVSFVGGISVTGFEEVMDLQLTGNVVTGTPAGPTQCGGAPCVDYYLEEVGGAFRLEEIPDTPATTASSAYINTTNDAGPVTIFGVIDLSNGQEISGS